MTGWSSPSGVQPGPPKKPATAGEYTGRITVARRAGAVPGGGGTHAHARSA